MSQNEIDNLLKLLGMKSNNVNNIKNILRYLYKLQERISLLPLFELNEIISSNLTQLEIQDVDVSKLTYEDVIDLLKTHRNKKAIRKFIYDNLNKIIIYNSLSIDFNFVSRVEDLDILLTDLLDLVNTYNKNIMIEIIMDNKKFYNDEQIKDVMQKINENKGGESILVRTKCMI